jgi:branched-chain amino acid transport system substrate-binding protein
MNYLGMVSRVVTFGRGNMSRKLTALIAVASAGLVVTELSACSSSSSSSASGTTLVISSDLPLQGSIKDLSDSTNKAIELYLKQVGYKAGKFKVSFKKYDDATAAKGGWDDATCNKNALAHVANRNEVAVIGTYNSGCAKIIVPILNQDPKGPMLMVSHANTNPGLTKKWNPGEPDVYYPKGKRNYARVCTTDDYQGSAVAQFAQQVLKIKKVYVLNDNQTYGQGVAQAFTTEAKKLGLTVLSSGAYGQAWDSKQPNYEALFLKAKALNPDMIYVGGIFDNNGGQLVKDKVKVLGDNTKVKFMGPDGFTGFPDLNVMPEAQGMYLSFAGLTADLLPKGGAGAKFLAAYKKAYKSAPIGAYPIYGVAAVQVVLAAIAKSNGTRKSINAAVFSGKGITIPAGLSVLGKSIHISTTSGDVNAKDITIELIKGNAETTLQPWTVK